jgi:hypothetical protein
MCAGSGFGRSSLIRRAYQNPSGMTIGQDQAGMVRWRLLEVM